MDEANHEQELKAMFLSFVDRSLPKGPYQAELHRMACRAMMQAAFEIAFDKMPREEAVRMLAEALSELNRKHAPNT